MDTTAQPQLNEFVGFEEPKSNYFQLPKEWINITAKIDNLAELKVVQYVLRHTWGYKNEYNKAKKITLDEFVSGRKEKSGGRIDEGTGLSEKSVRNGLDKAIEHGYLQCDIDDRDKGRIKRYFKLSTREEKEEQYNELLISVLLPMILAIADIEIENENTEEAVEKETERVGDSTSKLGWYDLPPTLVEDTNRTEIKTLDKNLTSNNSNSSKLNILEEKKKEEQSSNNPIPIFIDTTDKKNPVVERTGAISIQDLLKIKFGSLTFSKPPKTNEKFEIPKPLPTTKSIPPKASVRLRGITKELSENFGDMEHIRSNVAQMKNILFALQSRGVDEKTFIDFTYGVKGLVEESEKDIYGSKMGYFFKALKYNLRLLEKSS